MLTFEEIREIINLVNQSSIQYFELEQENTKIIVSKAADSRAQRGVEQAGTTCDAKVVSLTNVPSMAKVEDVLKEVVKDDKEEKLHTILSPTVGTFYSAPEPGANSFVTIGEQIHSNTIVCVLEAMKLFNEVEARVDGEVVEILVHDGDFIEYGQPLFLVRTDS